MREIIQSIRLTEAYPGDEGKQLIMQSYLNNNYYGNRSYGVAAAAQSYWHKDLNDLTLAQYALLAGIPKSPTRLDLVQNAVEEDVHRRRRQGRCDQPRGAADAPRSSSAATTSSSS